MIHTENVDRVRTHVEDLEAEQAFSQSALNFHRGQAAAYEQRLDCLRIALHAARAELARLTHWKGGAA